MSLMADLSTLKSSVTCLHYTLTTKVREAEARKDDLGIADLSKKLKEKLESSDSDFRNNHFGIIDLLEEESDLEHEQTILHQHDDEVLDLTTRLDVLVNTSPRPQSSMLSKTKTAGRRLEHLYSLRLVMLLVNWLTLMVFVWCVSMMSSWTSSNVN